MRLQDNENKREQHVIDIDFISRPNPIDYILEHIKTIKQTLESPEARIFYDDLYYQKFNICTDGEADKLIGPVLYREQESIDDFNSYKYLIKLYLNREIRKFFGYTLTEFINLSRYSRMIVVDEAEEHMKVVSERLETLQEGANGVSDDIEQFMLRR